MAMSKTQSTLPPPQPPQPPPTWEHSSEQIIALTQESIEASQKHLDHLVNTISPDHADFQSVIMPMAENDLITLVAELVVSHFQFIYPSSHTDTTYWEIT
jgi:metallopeptidase MepB